MTRCASFNGGAPQGMPDGPYDLKSNIKEGIDDKVKDAIESGKIKPEEVKAAAEKAMKGDSTSLIALMAGLPGLSLSEDTVEEDKANKYISVEIEGNEQFPMLNKTLVSDYLKSVIDPEEIESVDAFMDDEEGFEESSMYFFDGNEDPSEKDVEDWAKQEMSYYLFSKPDEFPGKEMNEANPNYKPAIGSTADISAEDKFNQLMSKYDWYYEMSDDPREYDRGTALDKQLQSLAKTIGVDKAVEIFNKYAPSDRKVNNTFFQMNEDKHAKIKEALKKGLKTELIFKKSGTSGGKEDLVVASSPTSKSQLTKRGYTAVPGTEDATGLK